MANKDNDLSKSHNKGQTDRAEGKKYNDGSSFLDYFEPFDSKLKHTDDKSKAYRDGWSNNEKQTKK